MKKTLIMSFRPKRRNLLGIKSKLRVKKKIHAICVGVLAFNLQLLTPNSFSQNVGINSDGSTPESNTMLEVKSTDNSSSSFGLKVKDSSGNSKMVVRSDGNVGIGTTTPDYRLTVEHQGVNNEGLRVFAGGTATDNVVHFSGNQTAGFDFVLKQNGNVGIGTTDPGKRLAIYGSSAGGSGEQRAAIEFRYGGTSLGPGIVSEAHIFTSIGDADESSPIDFRFRSTIGSGGIGDIMYLRADNGNIGIGNTNPKTRLQVTGGDTYIQSPGNGVILRSPDGATCRLLSIDNSGNLITTAVSCP